MNIFFGKISNKIDLLQIEEGYYTAPKDSSWFGELKKDDYVYLIGGDKIQFWRAKNYEEDRFLFEILNNDIGIKVNEFIALNFIRLTKSYLVLSSRSARGKAFFKLDLLQDIPVETLQDSSFYKDQSLYRKIVVTSFDKVYESSLNIQLYKQNDELKLVQASFFDPEVLAVFRNNLQYKGRGSVNKDRTLKLIDEALNKGDASFSNNELSLRSFYDALFCDYKEKDTDMMYEIDKTVEVDNQFLDQTIKLLKQKKNLILQGAPGTGKTYKTAEIAVALCNGEDKFSGDRKQLMTEYKQLVADGRVAFTTFHQSLDYEEFIEGIKPEMLNDNIVYEVKPGLFKNICDKAKAPVITDHSLQIRNNPTIWKVSLKGTYENEVRTDCLANNRIRIGWDWYGENLEDDATYKEGGKWVLDAFINKMQLGDIVMSCYSNREIDAIGVITGEYEWDNSLTDYKRCRKVNWLLKSVKEDIYDLNKQTVMTLSTVYRLNNISLEDVMSILNKYKTTTKQGINKNTDPYVLIIDEINRGNVSKIFGELITLLEADKRLGETNEVKVKLPYTKEDFGVPDNLYIIGTMNTADRSLGYIDYAIRRRFAFKTLSSDVSIIKAFYSDDILSEKIVALYESIEDFMRRYIERDLSVSDLMLGHSYFLTNDEDSLKLKIEFEIIPLLIEYEKDGILRVGKDVLNQFCDTCLGAI